MSRGRPAAYDQQTRDRAVELRRQGLTNREVATRIGLSTYQVEHIMRTSGNAGRWHHYRPPMDRKQRRANGSMSAILVQAIRRYGSVNIEDGLNGGYIATVADVHTGEECPTIAKALQSAECQAEAVEGWRFAG